MSNTRMSIKEEEERDAIGIGIGIQEVISSVIDKSFA